MRTDTLWKTLGRIHVLHATAGRRGEQPQVLVLTSNLPRPGSEGDKALHITGPNTVFDAIELYDPAGLERLARYGAGAVTPLPGFWSQDELDTAGL